MRGMGGGGGREKGVVSVVVRMCACVCVHVVCVYNSVLTRKYVYVSTDRQRGGSDSRNATKRGKRADGQIEKEII